MLRLHASAVVPTFLGLMLNCNLLALSTVGAEEDTCSTNAIGRAIETDELTEECYKAYCALPRNARQGDVAPHEFKDHVLANRAVYETYDNACFNKWDELRNPSKEFLSNIIGALFYRTPQGLIF